MDFDKVSEEMGPISPKLVRILSTAKRERDNIERSDHMRPFLVPCGFAFAVIVLMAALLALQAAQ
ncbi:hypothetical protein [Nitratireductor basaltis]|uniref:Uncharacterized protein n=1 Tax=Nitratireductor basaltis TaxID=472175 RepID=A0A084UDK8_9HYPH|nr:hypothetical protein [Nitratireductor basaltis]KFB11044.1 hypothetical protein EL18_02086 [Nitratireductor basaltis]